MTVDPFDLPILIPDKIAARNNIRKLADGYIRDHPVWPPVSPGMKFRNMLPG